MDQEQGYIASYSVNRATDGSLDIEIEMNGQGHIYTQKDFGVVRGRGGIVC